MRLEPLVLLLVSCAGETTSSTPEPLVGCLPCSAAINANSDPVWDALEFCLCTGTCATLCDSACKTGAFDSASASAGCLQCEAEKGGCGALFALCLDDQ